MIYIISYHIIWYHISYHIISYHIISYHIISYYIVSSLTPLGVWVHFRLVFKSAINGEQGCWNRKTVKDTFFALWAVVWTQVLRVFIFIISLAFLIFWRHQTIKTNALWGAFAKSRKRLLASSCLSVCPSVLPSVRTEQFGSHWMDFREI